jgi:hypothetical protein
MASISAMALSLLLAWPTVTLATTDGSTPEGITYVSGGVSGEELQALTAGKSGYSLWVTTAAVRSGAHLADARARVLDSQRQVVLDVVMDGPWLFANLPVGTYTVEVTFEQQVKRSTTTIHAGDHHQQVFYFISPDEVEKTDALVMSAPLPTE